MLGFPPMSKSNTANTLKVLAWPYNSDRGVNPYASLLYEGLVADGSVLVTEFNLKRLFWEKWDVIHVHWPDGFWPRHRLLKSGSFSFLFLTGLIIARLRGAKLIWTTHNSSAHEKRNEFARRVYMHGFTKVCDGIISLSDENRNAICMRYSWLANLPGLVTAHGLYDDHYPRTDLTPEQCRNILSLPPRKRVLLALGNLRVYKGYSPLIEAFRKLPESVRNRWTLVIVGKSGPDRHGARLTEKSRAIPEVIVRDTFVPEEDISVYMKAASLVALPYRNMQNSGAAYLAMTFSRPVLAPDIGSFRQMAREFPSRVFLFSGSVCTSTLADILGEWKDSQEEDEIDWKHFRRNITKDTIEFYRSIVDG